ncbi:DUF881 domain-containing protein [Fictibacillus sp. FJAT-27399]|uniref:DUF881 domain-containing protein n=1 Tax=Fictibacillus sp. FJAT-27399 TaxID=1729689 RepID=UPI000AA7A32A|nr:DUF881 domain-containing protein [Fictibacillus sp. FJAT-27399]
MKPTGKYVFFSIIMLVTGFFLSYSYQITKKEAATHETNSQWKQEDGLRSGILRTQKTNRKLNGELKKIQLQIQKRENKLADQEKKSYNLVEDLKKMRKVVGSVKVKGPGIEVTLSDSSYVPDGENPNNYIVHEEHIRSVIYEMLVSGAEAVAVNGQRISHSSYITCVGPVVSVDGNQYPAPFTITAIGDKSIMEKSLNLSVVNDLVNDGIEVRVATKDGITMDPYLSKEG